MSRARRVPSRTWLTIVLTAILIGGAFRAARFASADPSARAVYNLDIDTTTYDVMARALAAQGDWRAIPASQPPGFIAALALIYRVFGPSYLAAKLVFCVLLTATALLTALTAWRRLGALEGTIAGALTIGSPLLVAYAATIQYEILAAFLTTATLALLLGRERGRRLPRDLAWAAALAVLCVMAALTREVLLVLFPIVFFAALVRLGPHAAPRRLAAAVLMLGIFVAPIGAWAWAQHARTGQWVVISSKSNSNLRIGNNPAANGTYNLQLEPIAEPSGVAFMRARPAADARLAVRKVLYFWGLLRDPWTVPQFGAIVLARATADRLPLRWAQAATNGVFLLLFVMALACAPRAPALWPICLTVLAVLAVHIVYFGAERFSVPVAPEIYLAASVSIASLARAIAARTTAIAVTSVALVWIVVAQFLPFHGTYTLDAADLEGLSAANVVDSAAASGQARFGAAVGGRRPIAFLSAVALPRGVYGVGVRARAGDCAHPDRAALTIAVHDEARAPRFSNTFTVGDLCASGATAGAGAPYTALGAGSRFAEDTVAYLSITTSGTVDVFIDRVAIDFGYERFRDLPGASQGQK